MSGAGVCADDVFDGGESSGGSSSAAVGSVASRGGGDGKWMRRTEFPLLCDFLFSEDDFEIDRNRVLVRTSFSDVVFAVQKSTGLDVAVRFMDVDAHRVAKQAMLLVRCAHPLILPLVGFGVCPSPFLVTKYMRNGDLAQVLGQEFASKPPAGWGATAKSKCVFGIAAGMAFLHFKEIVHRDLKPDNVFLDDDFEPVISDASCSATDDIAELLDMAGTPLFMAPEVLSGDVYDKKVDVYSFSVLLYLLFNQKPSFEDGHERRTCFFVFHFMHTIVSGGRFARGDNIPDFYWDLICKCWSQDPKDRPSFVEIVEHLRSHTSEYALDGSDLSLVRAYEKQVLESISDVLAAES